MERTITLVLFADTLEDLGAVRAYPPAFAARQGRACGARNAY